MVTQETMRNIKTRLDAAYFGRFLEVMFHIEWIPEDEVYFYYDDIAFLNRN